MDLNFYFLIFIGVSAVTLIPLFLFFPSDEIPVSRLSLIIEGGDIPYHPLILPCLVGYGAAICTCMTLYLRRVGEMYVLCLCMSVN